MKNRVNKIVMTLLLVVCIAVSVFAVSVFANDTDSTSTSKIDNCEKVVKDYSATDAAAYINGQYNNEEYPTLDGYLFAGWYTTKDIPAEKEAALAYVIKSADSIPEGTDTVYALFVKDHVLSVKAQVSGTLLDNKIDNDASASIRFVTTVDSLVYQGAGIEVSYTYGGVEYSAQSTGSTVYEKLYYVGSDEKVWEKTPSSSFCGLSNYFRACTITDVPSDAFDIEFTAKPYWITMSGEKVYGETAVKKVSDVCREEVWVSSATEPTPTDAINYGSYEYPYATLDYAIAHVKDGGTVHVKDTVQIAYNGWKAHDKNVTITGDNSTGDTDVETLEITGSGTNISISIKDDITFTDIELKLPTANNNVFMYAEGHKLIIKEDVTLTNSSKLQLYGGSSSEGTVASTHLEVYAGSYVQIAGGGRVANSNVSGDTKVIVGGNAVVTGNVYGAGARGTIGGNTYVEVKDEAVLKASLYGGGHNKQENGISEVKGATYVTFAGKSVWDIYGGSFEGTNGDTHVVMAGGEAHAIYGGCYATSMTGDTDVQVLGGTVTNGIYGGCYNEYKNSAWTTAYTVTGQTRVTIGPDATLTNDVSYCAVSRYGTNATGETGILMVYNEEHASEVGWSDAEQFSTENVLPYHYLVKVGDGGEVVSADGSIDIKANEGKTITVKVDGQSMYYTEAATLNCPLPAVSTDVINIEVIFTDKAEYEAQIGNTPYTTLTEAVDAANDDTTSESVVITVLDNVELTAGFSIKRNIEFTTSDNNPVIISGSSTVTGGLIDIQTGKKFTIDGAITISGNNIARTMLISNNSGTFTLGEDAAVVNAKRTNEGSIGAAFYNGGGTAHLHGDFIGNTALAGAAVRVNKGTVTIYEGTYSNNTATDTAGYGGGAILVQSGTVNIEDGEFNGNSAQYGGAIRNLAGATVKISGGTYSNNTAYDLGGVIFNQGTLEITGGIFQSNTAKTGGAINTRKATGTYAATVKNAFFYKNSAEDGGAMYCQEATIENCTFGGTDEAGGSLGNSAKYGGAISQTREGTITITDCTFDGNTATEKGKNLYSTTGTITVTNSGITQDDIYETEDSYIELAANLVYSNKKKLQVLTLSC